MTASSRSAAALSRSDLHRLERLAEAAGTTPARILKSVLRDGFEYTEWFVRQVNEGEADLKAGRVMSTEEVLSLIERQRASRGRKSAAA
jgi:predicted transcriptional regulator